MENNYGFKYFNEEIVNEVVAFYDSKSDDKERASALKAKVKENYKKLDASLKEENKARLAQAKNDYLAKIAFIIPRPAPTTIATINDRARLLVELYIKAAMVAHINDALPSDISNPPCE